MIYLFHVEKCIKDSQLNIIKITEKGYRKKARERYQDLSEEEKNKTQQYVHERYKNLSENKKQKLVEYRKKHCKKWKNNVNKWKIADPYSKHIWNQTL